MTIMADARVHTMGVDTHKDVHVAAVLGPLGELLGTGSFANDTDGYVALLEWAKAFGPLGPAGVEGTGSWGARLSRFLTASDVSVIEVNRADRATRRRVGKSDTTDAVAAARAVLAGTATVTPKAGTGVVEALRPVWIARRSAVRARTRTANQIHGLVDTAPDVLARQWAKLEVPDLARYDFELGGDPADPVTGTVLAMDALTRRWLHLDDQVTAFDDHLDVVTVRHAPRTRGAYGVGPITCTALLVAAGDNPHRLRSEAAFASLCAACPIPASSGKTSRHRLNRAGNREANWALWTIVMVRLSHDEPTKAYMQRRTKQGRSTPEIMRCLKRYVARELYPHIIADLTH